MCRLLAIVANKDVDICFSFGKFAKKFSRENPQGWGIGWYESGEPRLKKEPCRASESPQAGHTAANARSNLFIVHVRYATEGRRARENCHPFRWNNWLFAHNGSVRRDALLAKLNAEHREGIEGETDSEVFFHWILQNIESEGAVERGIAKALEFARDVADSGLNFLLTDGKTLYAYREAACHPDYYTLYYLVRDPQEGPAVFRSKEVNALLESKALNREKALLVCSEPLTDENWEMIHFGQLLVASGPGEVRLEKIAD